MALESLTKKPNIKNFVIDTPERHREYLFDVRNYISADDLDTMYDELLVHPSTSLAFRMQSLYPEKRNLFTISQPFDKVWEKCAGLAKLNPSMKETVCEWAMQLSYLYPDNAEFIRSEIGNFIDLASLPDLYSPEDSAMTLRLLFPDRDFGGFSHIDWQKRADFAQKHKNIQDYVSIAGPLQFLFPDKYPELRLSDEAKRNFANDLEFWRGENDVQQFVSLAFYAQLTEAESVRVTPEGLAINPRRKKQQGNKTEPLPVERNF